MVLPITTEFDVVAVDTTFSCLNFVRAAGSQAKIHSTGRINGNAGIGASKLTAAIVV